MGLYDTDKNSQDRSAPMPNHSDTVDPGAVKAHGTNSVNFVTDATTASTNSRIKVGFKRMVYTDTTRVTWGGASTTTTSTVPHPLGYAPLVEASVNHANFTGSITLTDANLPLPTWVKVDTSGATLGFITFMSVIADASNIYFITFNSSAGTTGSLAVTYYLYQQAIV